VNSDAKLQSEVELGKLLSGLDTSASRDAELARSIEAMFAGEGRTRNHVAVLLAGRLSIADRRIALLARLATLMARRLLAVECRSERHANKISDHEEALRMVCEVLQELDDPYGFGKSLDERIAGDGPSPLPSEFEG
jgi:hypothetical protein